MGVATFFFIFRSFCNCYSNCISQTQGYASKKDEELLFYKRRQEQLQNDLMNTSIENRSFMFTFPQIQIQYKYKYKYKYKT